jgi:hypothetical protein
MKLTRVSAYVFAVATSLAGCTGTGDVEYAGEVRVSSPELIEISPGVQVIADADEPLFYSDGTYWLYRDGYWLRSNDYRRNFARVQLTYVPQRIRSIERPQTYAQYRRHSGRNIEARNTVQPRRTPEPPPPSQSTYPAIAKPSPGPHDWPARPTVPSHSPPAVTPYVPNEAPPRATRSPSDVQEKPMQPNRGEGLEPDGARPDRDDKDHDKDHNNHGNDVRNDHGNRGNERAQQNKPPQRGASDEARDRKTDEKKDKTRSDE